jgi:hypothetical protein
MRDSGEAASLSHAVRLVIQEYRREHEKNGGKKKEEVRERMMDDAKVTPQSCRLCFALNKEIEKTRLNGETEREAILKFLLSGHREACHDSK